MMKQKIITTLLSLLMLCSFAVVHVDAQEAESREDSFMGRFRLMLREELKGLGNTVPFQSVSEPPQPSQENAEQTLAFLNAFDGME